ncbi:MAG: hypothetical protein HQK53_11705 [Oligoflexia bacterium]|nr:hypothetical protein [Oligoflexia bacterium]
MNELSAEINGQSYRGWLAGNLYFSLNHLASAYGLVYQLDTISPQKKNEDISENKSENKTDNRYENRYEYQPEKKDDLFHVGIGDTIRIYYQRILLLSGYINSRRSNISRDQFKIIVSGRSQVSDLIDCSLEGAEYRDLSAEEICQKVCAPFSIKVSSNTSKSKTLIPLWTVAPGERAFCNLERLSKVCGFILNDHNTGELLLDAINETRSPFPIDSKTIMEIEEKETEENIYSDYVRLFSSLTKDYRVVVKEELIQRHRPRVIVGDMENNDWIKMVYRQRSKVLIVEVDGWMNAQSQIWQTNLPVTIDYPLLNLRGNFLITEVNLRFGHQSSPSAKLQLELM